MRKSYCPRADSPLTPRTMCARRFLYVILILTLLVVLGAFAIFQFGDRVIASQSMPTVEFVEPEVEPDNRYEALDHWWARPGIDQALTGWTPENAGPDVEVMDDDRAFPLPEASAIFYVHPTTYLQRDRWNAPLELEGDNLFRTQLFLRTQASAFSETGNIWAPRYRQAAFGAFLSREEDAMRALDVAYDDVKAAFDVFIAENPDRPIILASHSQGSLHLLRLLAEEQPEFGDRLVAAYLVGWPIDVEADLPATGLPLCAARRQTGCIMNWLTFGDPADPDLVLDQWADSEGYAGNQRSRDRLACVNPILGGGEPEPGVPSLASLLIPDQGFRNATLEQPGLTARCIGGLLTLEGDVPDIGPYVLPGNNYHAYDYALFWGNVRQDATIRHLAWNEANRSGGQ